MAPGGSTKPGFRQDPVQARPRRDLAGSGRAGVTNSVFGGAVAGSVLVTFVVGFIAGALSRTHVLRWVRTSLLKRHVTQLT